MKDTFSDIRKLIETAKSILIIQADNPDGDSLASALALEQILHDLGKEPHLYCGIDIPSYLKYLPGHDRVEKEIPNKFDLSIIVDTSSRNLLETADKSQTLSWIAAKPCVVIDHHQTESSIDFATIHLINPNAVSTGEIIYELAQSSNWKLDRQALNMIATSILSDSLGLMTESTTARSIHIVAELVEQGVKLAELDAARRDMMKKSVELTRYKGELLTRIQYHYDDSIASITIPWDEIEKYSHAYNPSMLVLEDMRLTENTQIAIAFKLYPNNRITAKIRANHTAPIADKIAEHFGGGGHVYASGFKVQDKNKSPEEVQNECITITHKLLTELEKNHETI